MQQRSLNSHFKVKKNKRDDSLSDTKGNEKNNDLLFSEKKNNINSTKSGVKADTKQLVFQTATRAKRVSRANEDSFEEPEVIGKRVKLEKNNKKSHDKNEKIVKTTKTTKIDSSNIMDSFKNATANGRRPTPTKKKDVPVSVTSEATISQDINMKELTLPLKQREKASGSKSTTVSESDNNINNQDYINKLLPQQTQQTKLIGLTSLSPLNSHTPTKPGLSDFTKNMVSLIMNQKKEKDEKMKITGNFNYLNYKQFEKSESDITITPKKILGFTSHFNQNSSEKDKISSLTPIPLTASKKEETSNVPLFMANSIPNSLTTTPIKTPIKPVALTQPKLSLKTIQEISKLKTERQNRFKRETVTTERTRSESSFSLKFKYEELLKEERELLLPPHYKSLFTSFTELDHTLNLFKLSSRKQRIPIFEDIKTTIESQYKHKFEFKTFLQILYVTPHLFQYKWEKLSMNNDEFSLIIDIPKDHKNRLKNNNYGDSFNFITIQTENYDPAIEALTNFDLDERRNIFKNLLYAITNEQHKNFLESIQYAKEYDPFKFKTWHNNFNLEKITQIPIFEILDKPTIKITSIHEFLRETNIKNSLVKRAVDEINNNLENQIGENMHTNNNNNKIQIPMDQTEEDKDETSSQTNSNSNLSKFLSTSFIKKMKAKEEAVSISKNIIEYSTHKNRTKNKAREFQDLADKLHTIFLMQKKTTVPLIDLIQKLYNSSESIKSCYTVDNLKNLILKLKEVFPHWVNIIEHSHNGTLVRIEKVNMIDINQKLTDQDLLNDIEASL